MKQFKTFIILALIVGAGYLVYTNYNVDVDVAIDRRDVTRTFSDIIPNITFDDLFGTDTVPPAVIDPSTMAFYEALGQRESGGDYTAVNQFGYIGKYQFHKRTLKWIGIETSKHTYLNSPALQEESVRLLVIANKKLLANYLTKYDGATITYKGKKHIITKSGMLAGAHLAGHVNVKNYLSAGTEFKDGNGTHVAEYIIMFSGYEI